MLIDAKFFKVIKIPKGKAPKEIKKVWIDNIFPINFIADETTDASYNILSKKLINKTRRNCFFVDQEIALEILEKNNPESAKWWRDHGYPIRGHSFDFGNDEVKLIKE